ncbi:MAG: threonine synthase [Planctomycetota bacterium]|nr:threonine synthase [Planctomycetota bacterium]
MSTDASAFQQCTSSACGQRFDVRSTLIACPACGSMLDVAYAWRANLFTGASRGWSRFEARSLTAGPRESAGAAATTAALDFSGVWRFRDLMPFFDHDRTIVTIGEGRTNLQRADQLARSIGFDPEHNGRLYLQYEGFNPSGSFKDNGMCAAFTHARMVGARSVACASTGNTSASLGLYSALTGLRSVVFIGEGKIAYGKLSQALEYGSLTLQVAGDFDACLARVRHIAEHMPKVGVYLMNSVNPFRLEGQKSIMYRVLQGLDWRVPDWIVVPGGNLGNCSAFGKAFIELKALGLIDRVPRLAVINARGASTLDRIYNGLGVRWTPMDGAKNTPADSAGGTISPELRGSFDTAKVKGEYERMDRENERAHTIASAIEINRPVNLAKALRALWFMNGVVRSVDDHCILEHKALVGRFGFGCEPASAASVAGARVLLREGVIKPHETVACVLTGHVLKDPDATVGYHMGEGDGHASAAGGARTYRIPLGRSSNGPKKVRDDLDEIVNAMG